MALDRPVLIPQILSRGFPAAVRCRGRVNLLLTVGLVVELGSKTCLKRSWCDAG